MVTNSRSRTVRPSILFADVWPLLVAVALRFVYEMRYWLCVGFAGGLLWFGGCVVESAVDSIKAERAANPVNMLLDKQMEAAKEIYKETYGGGHRAGNGSERSGNSGSDYSGDRLPTGTGAGEHRVPEPVD